MISTATLPDFKSRFGANQARLVLLAALDDFLLTLQANFKSFRILAYGSFISDKEYPSDIDVMVHVCGTSIDPGFNKFKTVGELAVLGIDVFTLSLSMSFDKPQPPPDAESMLEHFNGLESHLENGTKCDHAIELLLR